MNEFAIYIIKTNASLIVFYACLKLFFHRDTFWIIQRFYLLFSIVFSAIYPFISLEKWLMAHKPIMNAMTAIHLDEFVVSPHFVVIPQTGVSTTISLGVVLLWISIAITLSLLIRLILQSGSILFLRAKGTKDVLLATDVIKLKEKVSPFSFFQWIFINPTLHNYHETKEILVHEQTHVRQWHSFDVLIARLLVIFFWYNPIAWLLEREIRYNLEYIADNKVLSAGFERKKYQYHLIRLSYEASSNNLTNQFKVLPIKKRIIMMNTKKSKKWNLLKYTLVAPVCISMLLIANAQNLLAMAKTHTQTFIQDSYFLPSDSTKQQTENKQILVTIEDQSTKSLLGDNEKKTTSKEYNANELIVGGSTPIDDVNEATTDKEVFELVDLPPAYPGGIQALYKFLGDSIQYPKLAHEKGIQGKVICTFVVSSTGKITNIEITRSVDPILDKEALRVIQTMPNWIPGKLNGKNVNVRYTLPILFKLNNDSPSSKSICASGNVEAPELGTPPNYPGGNEAMFKFLAKTIKYPVEAQKRGKNLG